jgi:3alpha(or 20beta)-hydroxysteroid dehydrogenase
VESLEGKVALVTGAGRGMGAAHAWALAAAGARVVVTDVGPEIEQVVAEIGGRATAVPLDVTDEDAWAAAVEVAEKHYGGLHVLVNNAGVSPPPRPIAKTSVDEFRRVLDVNLVGMFAGIHVCAPVIARSGGGSIVNVSSINGFEGGWGIAGYASSKFAIRGLTKTAAIELGRKGIRVNSVHPGPVDTSMISPETWGGHDMRPALAAQLPLGRVGQPKEIAELVLWLASDASSFCTGAEFVIDGGSLAGPGALPGT